MLKYILRDMQAAFQFMPAGIVAGILVLVILIVINKKRIRRKERPIGHFPMVCYFAYLTILLALTFFSREGGSRHKVIDMDLFSTWNINTRNKALVIENILLFVPYGVTVPWMFSSPASPEELRKFWKFDRYPNAKRLLVCTGVGFLTSLFIEIMQLVTGRGFFQLDDILTNVIGTMIGYGLFRIFAV